PLVVRDGDDAVAGAIVRLNEQRTAFDLGGVVSGPDGGAGWFGIGASRYTVRVEGDALWPTSLELDSAPSPSPSMPSQIRRRGAAELLVTDGSGLPIADVAFDLVSSEFHAHAADWLDAGRISGNLRTDLHGRAALTGLPRGPYTWSATLPGGVS